METKDKRQFSKIKHNLISELNDKISHFISKIQDSFLHGRIYDFSNEQKEKTFKIYYGISITRRSWSYTFCESILDYIFSSPFVLDQECLKIVSNWGSIKNTLRDELKKEYEKNWSCAIQTFDIKCYNRYLEPITPERCSSEINAAITPERFSSEINAAETEMLKSFKQKSRKIIEDNINLLKIDDGSYDLIISEQSKLREQKIRANFKKLINNISSKYIEIQDEQNTEINTLNSLGQHIKNIPRPPVYGSELLQMRHVTPYSFMSRTLQNLFQDPLSYKYISDSLATTIKSFPPRSGLCIKDSDLSKISTKLDVYLKVITDQNKYCFIHDTPLVDQLKIDRLRAASLHQEKWPKVIDYFCTIIKNIVPDEASDSDIEIFYSIVLYILIMFNQSLYAAFPEEGNTVNYEIRLYKTEDEASRSLAKNYTLLSHDECATKLSTLNNQNKQCFNRKIAVVDNEGTIVDRTITALDKLQCILNFRQILAPPEQGNVKNTKLSKQCDELIGSYNKINKLIIVDKTIFAEHYYNELNSLNFAQHYLYHVVRHLYDVFDCKPLEHKVFVEASPNEHQDKTEVWRFGAIKKYCVMDGKQYREREIKNTKNNYTIEFRHSIPEDQFQIILSKAIAKHIIVSSILFPQLFQISLDAEDDNTSDKICKEFIRHVQNCYQYNDDFYTNTYKLYNDYCGYNDANISLSTVLSGELHHQDV